MKKDCIACVNDKKVYQTRNVIMKARLSCSLAKSTAFGRRTKIAETSLSIPPGDGRRQYDSNQRRHRQKILRVVPLPGPIFMPRDPQGLNSLSSRLSGSRGMERPPVRPGKAIQRQRFRSWARHDTHVLSEGAMNKR